MTSYLRQKVWAPGELLSSADLNAEFDEIATVLQALDESNFTAGVLERTTIINAGSERFAPLGTEDDATRVSNAIASLSGATTDDSRVIWVPVGMLGYIDKAGFSVGMFDPNILMVREGQLKPAVDPVAYGAAPGLALDQQPAFQAAFDAANSTSLRMPHRVAVDVEGDYQIDTQITWPAGVAFEVDAGVTFSGAASPVWTTGHDPVQKPHSWIRMVEEIINVNYSVGDTTTGVVFDEANYGFDAIEEYYPVFVRSRIKLNTAGSYGDGWWAWGVGSQIGNEPGGDLIVSIDSLTSDDQAGANPYRWATVQTVSNDGGGALDGDLQTELWLARINDTGPLS